MKQPLRRPKNRPRLVVVGLGNPGETYRYTRHNAGYRVVDYLAEVTGVVLKKPLCGKYLIARANVHGRSLVLAKPLTYMNRSGDAAPAILRKTHIGPEKIVVVCDTLDLPSGKCRLKRKGGSAGHKGIASIIETLGTGTFPRMYVGIGRPVKKSDVADFVLSAPSIEDRETMLAAEKTAALSILRLLEEPIERVMYDLNRKEDSESS